MSSAMYYRLYPARILYKTYGFQKVTKEEETAIVERLGKHTNSTQVYTDDMERYRKLHHHDHYGAPPKRFGSLQTVCPRNPKRSIDRHPHMYPDDYIDAKLRVEHITRRLYRSSTQATDLRYMEPEHLSRDAVDRKQRPASAAPRMEETKTCDELRKERQKLQRLCRPTTATKMKVKGRCPCCTQEFNVGPRITTPVMCPECFRLKPQVNANNQPPPPPPSSPPPAPPTEEDADDEDAEDNPRAPTPPPPTPFEQQELLISRLRAPTRACQGGLPLCDKAPDHCADWMIGFVPPPRPAPSRRSHRHRVKSAHKPTGTSATSLRPKSAPVRRH